MSEIFADTGYWIALIDRRDQGHLRAVEAGNYLADHQIVTTEMVLTELLNYMSGEGEYLRTLTADAAAGLYQDLKMTVVPQTSQQFRAALQRYRSRPDQAWGIVDCASFTVMEERGIREALAFDRHFQQAGFTALLRDRE